MDPNTTLERALKLATEVLHPEDPSEAMDDRLLELAQAISDLHGWLSKPTSGFLPKVWERSSAPGVSVGVHIYTVWEISDIDRCEYIVTGYYGSWWAARKAAIVSAIQAGRPIGARSGWRGGWRPRQGGTLYDDNGCSTGIRVEREEVQR